MGIVTYETPNGERRSLENPNYKQIEAALITDSVLDDALIDICGVKVRAWGVLRKSRKFLVKYNLDNAFNLSNNCVSFLVRELLSVREQKLRKADVIALICFGAAIYISKDGGILAPLKAFIPSFIGISYWAKTRATISKTFYLLSRTACEAQAPEPRRYS